MISLTIHQGITNCLPNFGTCLRAFTSNEANGVSLDDEVTRCPGEGNNILLSFLSVVASAMVTCYGNKFGMLQISTNFLP